MRNGGLSSEHEKTHISIISDSIFLTWPATRHISRSIFLRFEFADFGIAEMNLHLLWLFLLFGCCFVLLLCLTAGTRLPWSRILEWELILGASIANSRTLTFTRTSCSSRFFFFFLSITEQIEGEPKPTFDTCINDISRHHQHHMPSNVHLNSGKRSWAARRKYNQKRQSRNRNQPL